MTRKRKDSPVDEREPKVESFRKRATRMLACTVLVHREEEMCEEFKSCAATCRERGLWAREEHYLALAAQAAARLERCRRRGFDLLDTLEMLSVLERDKRDRTGDPVLPLSGAAR
jgi:hypothetical protein